MKGILLTLISPAASAETLTVPSLTLLEDPAPTFELLLVIQTLDGIDPFTWNAFEDTVVVFSTSVLPDLPLTVVSVKEVRAEDCPDNDPLSPVIPANSAITSTSVPELLLGTEMLRPVIFVVPDTTGCLIPLTVIAVT
ncbi:MAG: hypothetical protein QM532_01335 [Cyanobium sp. MAG06]|nr:hypothetical protein [Cyanobium sp. MAG06]